MGPIWKSPVAHPYPIPEWVAPLPKHLQNIYSTKNLVHSSHGSTKKKSSTDFYLSSIA